MLPGREGEGLEQSSQIWNRNSGFVVQSATDRPAPIRRLGQSELAPPGPASGECRGLPGSGTVLRCHSPLLAGAAGRRACIGLLRDQTQDGSHRTVRLRYPGPHGLGARLYIGLRH